MQLHLEHNYTELFDYPSVVNLKSSLFRFFTCCFLVLEKKKRNSRHQTQKQVCWGFPVSENPLLNNTNRPISMPCDNRLFLNSTTFLSLYKRLLNKVAIKRKKNFTLTLSLLNSIDVFSLFLPVPSFLFVNHSA